MMGLYRKKPVVIEAMSFSSNAFEICAWAALHRVVIAVETDANDIITGLSIPTLEGNMIAYPGEWIIKGVNGEFYPCKPDIFAATYDPADVEASIAANMIVTPAQVPGDDSTLEREDDADTFVQVGDHVAEARYTRPRDKRVQQLLKDAERDRAAEAKPEELFKIYTDPRLMSGYRPKK